MKINTGSWHCKIQQSIYRGRANTLCGYFWGTVGAMIIVSIIHAILFGTTLISYFIFPIFGHYPKQFSYPIWPEVNFYDAEYKIYGITSRRPLFRFKGVAFYGYQLLLCGLAVYSISALGYWLWAIGLIVGIVAVIFLCWFFYIIFNKARRTDSWGILKEYLKAIKNKVCPLIEYID